MDRAWAIQQLIEVSVVGALGTGIDGIDRVIRPTTGALSASRAIRAVITTVIITTLVVSRAGSPFGFFSIGVSICSLYQFADGYGPLAVQLATELLVPEPLVKAAMASV